jgi:YVTN family beta-propeller protein
MMSRHGRSAAVSIVLALLAGFAQAQSAESGRLLVLNKEDATLAVVDRATGAVKGRVPVGQGPHELVVSGDGRWAFASNYGTGATPGHTISMIDVAALKELRRIDVAPLSRPHGLWFAGGKLYFTAEANKKIARYDPAADTIDWQFETGQSTTHMIVLTADGRTIVTSNIGSDSLSIVEQGAGGAWTQTVVPVGRGPEGIDLSPDGKTAWSAHSRDGGVSIVDLVAKRVVATLAIGTKRSNRIKLTPDGRLALVSDVDSGDLVVVDVATRQVSHRVPLGAQPEGVLVAPDGSVAFVAVNGDNSVAVVDLRTWRVARKIAAGSGPDGLAYLP